MRYETKEDLQREDGAAEYLAFKFCCTQVKSDREDFDRVFLLDGKPACFVEIKCRNNPSTRYQTYMIDWEKLARAKAAALLAHVPLYLAVSFTDGVFYWKVERIETLTVLRGGRTDRNDPNDRDWCAHIPMSKFTKA